MILLNFGRENGPMIEIHLLELKHFVNVIQCKSIHKVLSLYICVFLILASICWKQQHTVAKVSFCQISKANQIFSVWVRGLPSVRSILILNLQGKSDQYFISYVVNILDLFVFCSQSSTKFRTLFLSNFNNLKYMALFFQFISCDLF